MDIGDFVVFVVTFLLGLLIVLVLFVLSIAPFVASGLAAYYVFRGRVSRWALRALVFGIPLAVAFGIALLMGAMVLFLVLYANPISE